VKAAADQPAPRILVVDDNPSNLTLLEAQLRPAGYRVRTATSGRAALDAAAEGADLILLDVMMPGLDGYEVCRRLKGDERTSSIPVVMLTSLRERADKILALEAGADDFLSKPSDRAELLARIRGLLRMKRLGDDLAQSRDETSRQAELLAAEKSRAEAILFSIGDGVLTTDMDGRVTMLNQAAESIAGVTNEAVLGREWREALGARLTDGAPLTDDACPLRRALRGEQAVEAEDLAIWRPDGRQITVGVFASAVRRAGGQPVGAVAVLRDVTREREVEAMKREFVGLVSHELRSPTAVIFGFAELLMDEALPPSARRYVERIHRETERLSGMLQDFLDIERLEAGKIPYHLRSLPVAELIEQVAGDVRPRLERHQLVVDVRDVGLAARADRDRLLQVLHNLVGNAIKYSPEGGEIRVTAERHGQSAVLAVADQGLGLPRDAFARLFEKFYRVDRPDHRGINGTGLGLAICRRLIEDMGGRIWAESDGPGRGSTFRVVLPAAAEVTSPSATPLPRASGRVLLVKDDPGLVELIQRQLGRAGYEVEAVATGSEALERVRAAPPGAVVLDIKLAGEMDGWAVLKALREDADFADLPIIVMSGQEERAYGLALGVDDYLVKPVPAARLVGSVQRVARPQRRGYVLVAHDATAMPHLVGEALREVGVAAGA